MSFSGESLSEAPGYHSVLSGIWAGTAGRFEAMGWEDGVPAPILLQDHQCCSGSQGAGTYPLNSHPPEHQCQRGTAVCPSCRGKESGQGGDTGAVPLTVVPCRVVAAAQALPGVGAAVVGVAVAVAGLAAGEAPEARQAAVTLPPVHPGEAVALARLRITEGVVRASDMALARCKERERGAVFPRQALNAGP